MLEVKDATIAVGDKILATALSFIARDGELTCLTGPEGSGKTTFIRTLMGFLPVRQGFVSVDGELLTVYSAHIFRKMMVYLPQTVPMLAHQLWEPEAPDCPPDDYAVWNDQLPSVVQEPQPEPLSGEEIYLLAEKTLREAEDRPIVIADEPTASMNSEQTLRMLELLREQARKGKTVLVASRKPTIIAYANQVIHLKDMKRWI